MKRIKLTQGKFAVVDDENYEYLNQFSWYVTSNGYARRTIRRGKKNQYIRMHNEIIGTQKNKETDHINRNKLDNRKDNLRIVTRSENSLNKDLQKNNTSGYKGISWNKKEKKWYSCIKINEKTVSLGRYKSIQGAWLARIWGERLYRTQAPNPTLIPQVGWK